MTRRVDVLGRIIIPKSLRNANNIDIGDLIQIYVDGDRVILRKYQPTCTFCGESASTSSLKMYKGKQICTTCAGQLVELSNIAIGK